MWFIWIMWVLWHSLLLQRLILLTGKGSMLVLGFNTKSPEERAKYVEKGKQAGWFDQVFVDIGLLALTSYISLSGDPGDTK